MTAARSGEVRLATWDEIDTAGRVWTIAAERMKMSREHRVPLSPRALEVLEAARSLADGNPLVFPNRWGNRIRDTFLSQLLKDLDIAAVPHGFRSSFRDWAAEETDHPREVIEAALAHAVRNPVEAAYARRTCSSGGGCSWTTGPSICMGCTEARNRCAAGTERAEFSRGPPRTDTTPRARGTTAVRSPRKG